MTADPFPDPQPAALGVGPELRQQRGAGRRMLDAVFGTRVGNGPGIGTILAADLPTPQRFPRRPRIIDGDPIAPGATASEMLPGRIRAYDADSGDPSTIDLPGAS